MLFVILGAVDRDNVADSGILKLLSYITIPDSQKEGEAIAASVINDDCRSLLIS
jgi:hypothetical protein